MIVVATHCMHVVIALLVVPVLAVAQGSVVTHLAIIHGNVILLVPFDELILLHLRDALCLCATCLAENATAHAIHRSIDIHRIVAASILILTLTMHTLHIEVTTVKTVSEVVNIVEKIALCTTRLVINFNLIDQTTAFNLEV